MYLSLTDAAKQLNLTPAIVRSMAVRGKIDAVKVGKTPHPNSKSVQQWVEMLDGMARASELEKEYNLSPGLLSKAGDRGHFKNLRLTPQVVFVEERGARRWIESRPPQTPRVNRLKALEQRMDALEQLLMELSAKEMVG